jgi:hypothetical protein
MTHEKNRPSRLLRIAASAIALVLVAGCDGPTDPATSLRDFVLDFARSALAAFLL